MRRLYFKGSIEFVDGVSDAELITRVGIKIKQLGDGVLPQDDSLMFELHDGAAPPAPSQDLPLQPL